MFRAGTSSRLKRLGLFRSCRREASPKTQGLSEDASHHAREHKTPTEGTANNIHRPAPKNQQLRYSGFLTLPLKVCCLSAEKVFGSTPFSKGVAGCRAGSPAKSAGLQGAGREVFRGAKDFFSFNPTGVASSALRAGRPKRNGNRKGA